MLKLDADLLRQALVETEQVALPFGERIATADLKWLRANVPQPELVDFLVEIGLNTMKQACAHNLFGCRSIVERTTEYRTINEVFVLIGSGPNGDFIAIPRATWDTIGYIALETFQFDRSPEVPFVAVSDSIGSFFHSTWHVDGFPCDYWEVVHSRGGAA